MKISKTSATTYLFERGKTVKVIHGAVATLSAALAGMMFVPGGKRLRIFTIADFLRLAATAAGRPKSAIPGDTR